MRLTIIHNPDAGEKERGETLVAEMSAAGHEVTYVNVKKAKLDEVLEEPGDLVVIAGGDGTVHKVVKKMIGRPTPVVVIPLGTANNIASTLGVHGHRRGKPLRAHPTPALRSWPPRRSRRTRSRAATRRAGMVFSECFV